MQITDAAMTPVFESVGLRSLGGARAKPKAVESPDGGTPIPWGAVSLPPAELDASVLCFFAESPSSHGAI